MSLNFQIPATIDALRALSKDPYRLGQASGELLGMIPGMVNRHLSHDVHDPGLHKNMKPISKSIDTADLAQAVEAALTQLRTQDGVTTAFPHDSEVDRKQRKPRRKYVVLYTSQIEKVFQTRVAQLLKNMVDWTGKDNIDFNKGFDEGYTGLVVWNKYPTHNVALKAGEEKWGVWLRKACEQLERETSGHH
ncbi:hypothetical protein BDV96DRAFT_591738 [Lophiotrema nucula]|uniref:Uncharacterized protein n=1 Tax=Lophiotrema nucula TaxID=690887 RepID=A0A6A5YGQ5_9PLEO|nr:hypothetical protein BDV96DRAFT_591738 [Lophiotrema nucula]